MERYGNLSRESGVDSYEAGSDFIRVRFKGGATYTYTAASAGQDLVDRMKRLAVYGKGLSSFISTDVGELYDRRDR